MEIQERPKKTFMAFARVGAFSRIVATVNADSGHWALFGVTNGVAVFMQKARGGVREWVSLDRLAAFLKAEGIARFEVHDSTAKIKE